MLKLTHSAGLLGLLGLLLSTGCSSSKSDVTEIDYWTGWSGHEFDIQQKLVDEFNRTHPKIHVRLISQFGNSGYQKVRIAFAGDATPDLMSTVWAEELASYAQRGVLTPLDGYMKASGRDLDREWVPSLRKSLRVDGKVYGLAIATNIQFLVYNRSIFKSVGLNPEQPPATPEDLFNASKACTEVRSDGTLKRYGYRPIEIRTWAYVFGGHWADEKGNITANDPRNVEALKWLKSFNQFIDPRRAQAFQAGFGNESSNNGPFFVGKIATWQTGEWAEEFIHRYGPKIDYAFQAFPAPKDGKPDTCYMNPSVFVIPKACKHKAEAWTFLEWLSRPAKVAEFCSSIGNVPALVESGNDPKFANDPLLKFAVNLSRSKNAVGPPGIAMWPTYTREMTRTEDAVLFGGADPKAALDDLQVRMSDEMKRTLEDLGR